MPFQDNRICCQGHPSSQQQKGQVSPVPACPGIPGKSCQKMIFFTGSSGQQLPLGSDCGWRVRFYSNKINSNHHLSLATNNPHPSAAPKIPRSLSSLDELFTLHHCCCRFPCLLPLVTIPFIRRQALGTFWLLPSISSHQHCQPLLSGNETITCPSATTSATPEQIRSREEGRDEEKQPKKD